MRWKNTLWAVLALLPFLALLAFGFSRDPRRVPFALAGKPAPTFELQTLEGETLSLKDLEGQPALLNFWSTWCQPCKTEYPVLQDAARRYKGKARVIGVIYQDEASTVRTYLQRMTNAYPHLLDPKSRVAIDFGVAGVPESFFLDAKGHIVRKVNGALTQASIDDTFTAMLEPTP